VPRLNVSQKSKILQIGKATYEVNATGNETDRYLYGTLFLKIGNNRPSSCETSADGIVVVFNDISLIFTRNVL